MTGSIEHSVGAAPVHPEENLGDRAGVEMLSDRSDPYNHQDEESSIPKIPINQSPVKPLAIGRLIDPFADAGMNERPKPQAIGKLIDPFADADNVYNNT